MTSVKEQVQKLAETLPENATWDQAMYELYVRQQIAEGEKAVAEGRVVSHAGAARRVAADPDRHVRAPRAQRRRARAR